MDQRIPDFSIIIPVFQNVKGVEQAILSILDQTVSSWEVIIIDDGSYPPLDIERLNNRDRRIKAFQLAENKGRSFARNFGIERATGRYLCFLDSDDEFISNHLESFVSHSRFIDQSTILRTRMIRRTIEGDKKESLNNIPDPIKHFLLHHGGIHTFAFPAEIVSNLRFHESYSNWEDYHFILQALSIGNFEQLDIHTAIYHANYSRWGEATLDELKERIELQFECIDDLQKKLETFGGLTSKDYEKAKSNSLLHYIENMVREKKYNNAMALMEDLRQRPLTWKQKARKLKLILACTNL